MVANAPMIFTGIYSLIKGWIDERTRRKVSIVGDPTKVLKEFCDIEWLPPYLGGSNEERDFGPWCEYEVVETPKKVGVRRIGEERIHTPEDIL